MTPVFADSLWMICSPGGARQPSDVGSQQSRASVGVIVSESVSCGCTGNPQLRRQFGLTGKAINPKCSTPQIVAKKPWDHKLLLLCIGGCIVGGGLVPKKLAVLQHVADTDPTQNVARYQNVRLTVWTK